MNKFKGYTYTEYQNYMCTKAIESNTHNLYCYLYGIGKLDSTFISQEEKEEIKIFATIHKYTFFPQYVGQITCEKEIERLEKAIAYLRNIRESKGKIIDPLYMSYWKNVYSKEV